MRINKNKDKYLEGEWKKRIWGRRKIRLEEAMIGAAETRNWYEGRKERLKPSSEGVTVEEETDARTEFTGWTQNSRKKRKKKVT